jgi:predicted membrane protein
MEMNEEMVRKWEKIQRRGKAAGGLLIVTIGSLFLARELGAEIPHWIFSWQMLLIGIGVVHFIKHGFSRPGWIFPVLIGGVFLITDFYPDLALRPVLWPVLIILLGLFIMFKPRRKFGHMHWRHCHSRYRRHRFMSDRTSSAADMAAGSKEDFIDSTSVMGGTKKNILSKNFRGGDITNVFGGTELDLTQADFEGKITLEITQVFGGTKLIVPAHWQIQSNMVTVMGSVEDKRSVNPQTGYDSGKILVLDGTTFLGGIEIKSF